MRQDEAIKKQNISYNNNSNLSRPVSSTAIHNHHINIYEKWTCMVCLSKHANKIDICSICGSSKPTAISKHPSLNNSSTTNNISFSKHYSSNTSPTSSLSSTSSLSPSSQIFSSYLLNELGLKHKLDQPQLKISITANNSIQNNSNLNNFLDQSKSNLISPHRNPYLKKWTCIHCNYSNDSLKVVCLNCRWLKTSSQQYNASLLKESSTSSEDSKSSGDATPTKRTKTSSLSNDSTIKQSSNQVCSSCKSPLHTESKDTAEKLLSSQETVLNTVTTPIKPLTNSLSSTSSIGSSASSSSKWTCDTCLVQNTDLSDKCVCCATAKPKTSIASSLSSLSNSTSSKWTCDTCLVSNDAEKLKCVCCMTDRPNSSKKTNQLSENKPLMPSLKPSMPVSTSIPSNIKLGLPSDTNLSSTGTISFGSSALTIPTSNMFKSSSEPIKFGIPSSIATESSLFKLPTSSNSLNESKPETEKSNNNSLPGSTTTGTSFSGFSFKPLEAQTNKPSQETTFTKPVENKDKKGEDDGEKLPKLTFGSNNTSTFSPFQFGNTTTISGGALPSLNSNTDTSTIKPSTNFTPFSSLFPSSTTKTNEVESKPAPFSFTSSATIPSTTTNGSATTTNASTITNNNTVTNTTPAAINPTASFSLFNATFGANQNKTTAQVTSENKDDNSNFSFNTTGFGKPVSQITTNNTNSAQSTPVFSFSSTTNAPPNVTLTPNTSEPFKLGSGFNFGSSTNKASSSSNNELPKLNFSAPSSSSNSVNLFGNTNQQSSSLFNTVSNSNNNNNNPITSLFSTNNSTTAKFDFAQNNTTTGANPTAASTVSSQPFSFRSPTNTTTTTTTTANVTPSFLQTTNSTPTSLFSTTPSSTNSLITPPSNSITQFNTPSIPASFGSITTPPSSIGGALGNNDLGQSNKLILNNNFNNQTPSFGSFNFNPNPSFNFANTQSGIMQFSGNTDSNVGDTNARKFRRAKRTVNR